MVSRKKLPKLKIKKHFGGLLQEERIYDFEEARTFLINYWPSEHWAGVMVAVEGQLVHSYDELVQLATQERYKDREFIEVGLYPQVAGG